MIDCRGVPVGFAGDLNSPGSPHGCTIVGCVQRGTGYRNGAIIQSMAANLGKHTEQMASFGVPAVDSVAELLEMVDCVFLTSWDGRVRLEQAMEVLRSRKPLFMDKPIAATFPQVLALYTVADALQVPVFSSSSLRWLAGCQAAQNGEYGAIEGADTHSPCPFETEYRPKPDLFH